MVCVFAKKKLIMKSFFFIFIYKGKLIAITLWNIFYFFVVQFLNKNFHYKGFDSIEEKKFFRCLFFLRKEALLWTLYAISPENSVLLKKRLQWCPIVIGNKAMRPTFSTRETINHEFQLWNSFVFLSFFFLWMKYRYRDKNFLFCGMQIEKYKNILNK